MGQGREGSGPVFSPGSKEEEREEGARGRRLQGCGEPAVGAAPGAAGTSTAEPPPPE